MRIPLLTLAAIGITAGCIILIGKADTAKATENLDFSSLATSVETAAPTACSETMEVYVHTEEMNALQEKMMNLTKKYTSPYDFEKLHEANEDIIAWVNIPGTNVDYPITFNGTEDYLHQNLDKEYSYSGTPFMDKNTQSPLKDTVNIIYGHHMKNGTIFSAIDDYNDAKFFKEHDEINIYSETKELNLHPLVSITGKADAAIRDIRSADDLKAFAKGKNITAGRLPDEVDELYVFVTCNYTGKDFRTYLVCIK